MRSISAIELENFQSHKRSMLELADLTALVGRSSAGKSSVERSLLWVFYGDWSEFYPTDNTVPTRVIVHLPDGTRIIRQRLGDKQTAWILKAGEEATEANRFKDFGAEIPGVFDVINLRPIIAGKAKVYINFAHQEPKIPFLVGDSKPAKAQLIGRLYGAHVVNAMLRLLNKDKLDMGRRVKEKDADLETLDSQISGYAGLEAREAAVKAARIAWDDAEALEAIKDQVAVLRAEAAALRERRWLVGYDFATIRASLGILDALEAIRTQAAAYTARMQALQPRRWLLGRDTQTVTAAVAELTSLEGLRSRLALVDTKLAAASSTRKPQFDSESLRKKLKDIDDLEHFNVALLLTNRQLSLNESQRNINDMMLPKARAELTKALFASGTCPLCSGAAPGSSPADLSHRFHQLIKS